MSFEDFIKKWTGKHVDFDGIYPDQCMDLAHQYVYEVLGITDKSVIAAPSAYQVYTNFRWENYFNKIANAPTNVPSKGDIVVWGTGLGPHGHIAIFVDGDVKKFNSFDANFPLGSLPSIQKHDYKHVSGWLHPITQEDPCAKKLAEKDSVIDGLRESRDTWERKHNTLQETHIKELKDKNEFIAQLQDQVTGASTQLMAASKQVEQLLGQIKDQNVLQDIVDTQRTRIINLERALAVSEERALGKLEAFGRARLIRFLVFGR